MIICIQARGKEIHYIRWVNYNGYYITMCSKSFSPKFKLKMNTYIVNGLIDGACPQCQGMMARNSYYNKSDSALSQNLKEKYDDIQLEFDTPQDRYGSLLSRRSWRLLKRLKKRK